MTSVKVLREVYFEEGTEVNQIEYLETVTLGLTKDATFSITIAGINCNSLIDTGASHRCTSKT